MSLLKRSVVVAILLIMTISLFALPVSASDKEASSEIALAQDAGENFILNRSIFPDWDGASLSFVQSYTNLEGQIIAFLYSVNLKDNVVGRVVVGAKEYNYDVFEAGGAPVPIIPDEKEVLELVNKNLGINIQSGDIVKNSGPSLVYLGYEQYYAVYDIKGSQIGINLRTNKASDMKAISSKMTSPKQYQKLAGEKSLLSYGEYIIQNVPLQGQADPALPSSQHPYGCGPTSGAMIAEYYKNQRSYTDWYAWHADYDYLYAPGHMGTGTLGTMPDNFCDGFEDYAIEENYSFDAHTDVNWNSGDAASAYGTAVTHLDDNEPQAVVFIQAEYADWHYCAVTGYYDYGTRYLTINNPAGEDGYLDASNWPDLIWCFVFPN